ncbi:hypothetical protein EPA93_24360 [Ktedonosporobacter rubrisoli]|uniref:Uncharacterized protein n=1 Tax=Ktedonosporobacter rubrisoli TaxID=2509675 RepID=A0A4P6JUD4_KTERU|nr:hypothetical protein [Ktedonosporobacter rubrisoli]QBD78945.1 hypothetical protein EPA93_24360 [Ktedonosporobacter rubrisoli]
MFKRYIRWILPLLALTLLVAFLVISNGLGAHAAPAHHNSHHAVTTDATITPLPANTLTPDFWHD